MIVVQVDWGKLRHIRTKQGTLAVSRTSSGLPPSTESDGVVKIILQTIPKPSGKFLIITGALLRIGEA
jgi:hypothetical protein